MVRHTLSTHVLPEVRRGRAPTAPTPVAKINPRRADITVPVLAINGALDASDHLRLARDLLAVVPNGREVLIPGVAHYPNLESPALFDRALHDFLADLDPTGGR